MAKPPPRLAPPKKKKKKPKFLPNWRLILWLLLILNVWLGLTRSPITSLRRVRVETAPAGDQARVRAILAELQNVPCLQINPRNVESLAMNLPEVRSAELTRNIFGSGRLLIQYRHAIARRFNANIGISADGVMYPSDNLSEDLPTIQLPPDQPAMSLALVGNWPVVALAQTAVEAQGIVPGQPVRIQVEAGGSVSLYIGSGRVVLGSTEDLDKKLDVLRNHLERNPLELSQVESLNLTRPDAPSVVRKKGEAPHESVRQSNQ